MGVKENTAQKSTLTSTPPVACYSSLVIMVNQVMLAVAVGKFDLCPRLIPSSRRIDDCRT